MKRILSALTAVTLAAGLSLAAVIAPASAADTPPTPADSSTPSAASATTPSTAPSPAPSAAPTATPTPTASPAPSAEPTPTVAAPVVSDFSVATATATTLPVPAPPTYETIVWSMASGANITGHDGSATYPQHGEKQYTGEASEVLNVPFPYLCGVSYQVDVYAQTFGSTDNTQKLDGLFSTGLAGPTNGQQDGTYLAGAGSNPGVFGEGYAWKYVTIPCPPPPPPCVLDSTVSYTYNPATNSGTITVPNTPGSSGVLCTPFYVTAASWTFDTSGQNWPQTINQHNHVSGTPGSGVPPATTGGKNQPIQDSGVYFYSASVGCGQGDIYASTSINADTLFPESYSVTPGHLTNPNTPFTEHFLSDLRADLGFTSTYAGPTYVVTGNVCNTVATPVTPAIVAASSCGQTGSIMVPDTTGVVYKYGGNVVNNTVLSPLSGDQTVIATPASGYKFADDVNGPVFSVTFTLHLGTPPAICVVTPPDPTAVGPTCLAPNSGSITVVAMDNVKYTLTGTGQPVSGTDFPTGVAGSSQSIGGLGVGTYHVTATGLNGVMLVHGGTPVATFTFDPIVFTDQCLNVLPAWHDGATGTGSVCTARGALGTITVTHFASEAGKVTYSVENDATHVVTNLGTSISTLKVKAGHYTVTATTVDPADGLIPDGPGFILPDVNHIHVTIGAAATVCADTSLAFTGGTIAWFGFVLAGGMLFLGLAFLLIRRRGTRTAD